MRRLTCFFVGLFFCQALFVNAQEKDCSQFMQYFENGDYNTVIALLLECKNDDMLSEIERKRYELYLQMSYGLIEDYENLRPAVIEDFLKDKILKYDDEILFSYYVLVHFYINNQEYNKVTKLNEELLILAKEQMIFDGEKYETLLISIASNYGDIGDYTKAIELAEEALNVRKKVLGENHPDYAEYMITLATYYSSAGSFFKSIELLQQVLSIYNKYDKIHSSYAKAINNLAHDYYEIGYYSKAIELGQLAVNIQKDVSGDKHPDYAILLNNLGKYYFSLGNNSLAKALFQLALNIQKDILGQNHPDYAISLNNLSGYYSLMSDFSRAIELGEEALNIHKNVLVKNSPEYAASLGNLANSYSSQGDYSKAIELGEEALNIRKNIFGENHPDYATSLGNLASYYSLMGDFSKAIELGEEALNIRKKVFGENHPENTTFLSNLATYYVVTKNLIRSAGYLSKAFQIETGQLQNQFSWLTEYERALYWFKLNLLFRFLPSFSYSSGYIPQFVNLSYDGVLLSKALLLNSSIQLNNLLMENGNEEVIEKFSQLQTLNHTLNKLYENPISERYLNTDSLEYVSQKLERELLAESKEYGDYTRFMSVTWQDVQENLKVQDVAIEFVEFPVLKTDSVMYAALVLRKDWEQPQMIPLFEKRELDKFLTQTLDKLYTGYVGKQLYRLMWKPLEEVIQKGDDVYFSAAGVYYQLALEYLPSEEGTPLCDMYNFRRLSSTRQLAAEQPKTTYNNATLYGGIQYDVNPLEMVAESKRYRQEENLYAYRGITMDSLRGGTWVALDNTVPEIEFISGELTGNKIKATVFTGARANEESIKALSGKKTSILHLATHGFFLPVGETRKIDYFQMLGRDNNPAPDMSMRRSGLIMAGGNRAWSGDTIPGGVDDGILTAQEISVLDFREMDLVVLSACETGLGDINSSEGVFGLQRAFKKAGANTLVMSLWKVNDQVTKSLMNKFYQELMLGKTKPEAFLEAQRYVRSINPDPQNWAAFIMLD